MARFPVDAPREWVIKALEHLGFRLIREGIRDDLIRVISARPMSRRERRVCKRAKEEATETDPEI